MSKRMDGGGRLIDEDHRERSQNQVENREMAAL